MDVRCNTARIADDRVSASLRLRPVERQTGCALCALGHFMLCYVCLVTFTVNEQLTKNFKVKHSAAAHGASYPRSPRPYDESVAAFILPS